MTGTPITIELVGTVVGVVTVLGTVLLVAARMIRGAIAGLGTKIETRLMRIEGKVDQHTTKRG